MRFVALDLGARKITCCEVVQGGEVVGRSTVGKVQSLMRLLGPNTPPARVAFEACREGWHVAEQLARWGHEPVMVDTTRVKQLGIGHACTRQRPNADRRKTTGHEENRGAGLDAPAAS